MGITKQAVRVLYLFYYLKKLDWVAFRKFMRYASREVKSSQLTLLADVLSASLRYNVSLLDYFYFRFYDKPVDERKKWAGTGFMYEFQREMNPQSERAVLEDKLLFRDAYAAYIHRNISSYAELVADPQLAQAYLDQTAAKVVLKGSRGQVGAEVLVWSTEGKEVQELLQVMNDGGYDMIEEYVVQHPALQELSNSGLNTVRIFSQLDATGQVHWLGARLRITVNSPVDNMAAGNLAAPIDLDTGIVNGPAVYSDITKLEASVHPITGVDITGFAIPDWAETLELVRKAAKSLPQNRSIGWDVAITATGPELIEGNHNWCKLLWQLPVKQGLKTSLVPYL